MANSPLFTVEDVKVDVTDSNALKAKENAFGQAQVKAFKEIAGRMLSESEAQNLQVPDLLTISSLIQDFEVTNEQLSSVRYLGTYTFRFKDNAVKRYFSGQGLQYTDVSSRPILILPFYQRGEQSVLWAHDNKWMHAWGAAENLSGVAPVVLPLGDLADVRDIGDDQALSYNQGGLSQMLNRYGAGEAVLAIAVPDEGLDTGEVSSGNITVHLYRTDRSGPEYVQEIRVGKSSGDTMEEALNDAVRKVYNALQRDWKSKTMVSAGQNNRLQVKVSFNTLDQWIKTKRALERVYGVNEVMVKSLSPKNALVDIMFQGTEERLRLALEQADMTLAKPRIDVSSMAHNPNSRISPMVYELYLNSAGPSGGSPYSQKF